MHACTRPNIQNIVGGHHRFLIVLYNEQRIAQIPKIFQRGEQLGVIPLMQANAWFIQNIKHANQARANLRC